MSSNLDIVVGGEASEAESDGGIALCRGETQRAEHVGRLGYAGCASGAGGGGDQRLQGRQDILRVEAVEPDVGVAGMAAFDDRAVDGNREAPALQEMNKRVALTGDPFALLEGCAADKELGCCCYANAERQRYGAGTQAVLLPTTIDQWLNPILQITATSLSAGQGREKQRHWLLSD